MSAGAAAAAAAALANAVAAAGGMVRVDPADFLAIADRAEQPLVVHSAGPWVLFVGFYHHYVMPYRGLTFVTKSTDPLLLPKGTELIESKYIYLPV